MALLSTNAHGRSLLRPRRETIALAAAGIVAALAYSHRGLQHHPSERRAGGEVWTGRLAAVSPAPSEPSLSAMSSASLVVPKAQLALPPDPPKPKFYVKTVCDSADTTCITRVTAPPGAPARKLALDEDKSTGAWSLSPPRPPGLIPEVAKQTNILDTGTAAVPGTPDHPSLLASAVRPFAAIGHAVQGWNQVAIKPPITAFDFGAPHGNA